MTTKEQVKVELDRMILLSPQNEDGQFVKGNETQASAAAFIEQVIAGDTPMDTSHAAAALLALKDIQVRDYALGLMEPDDETLISRLQWLTDVAPDEYINAPTTLLALAYYEKSNSNSETANELLRPAVGRGYSLALLLNRVFNSDWPISSFTTMRKELHPIVTKGIFGGENDDTE